MFLVKFKKKMNAANDQIEEQQTEKKREWAEREAKIKVLSGIRKYYNETKKVMAESKYVLWGLPWQSSA